MFCQNWDIIWTHIHLKWDIIVCFICISNIVYLLGAVLLIVTWNQLFICKKSNWVLCLSCACLDDNKFFVLKLNDVFKLQVCKLIHNITTGFDVKYNRFPLASSVHLQNTRFSQKMNFIIERPRTRLGLNCFRYLGPEYWSSIPETFKNLV